VIQFRLKLKLNKTQAAKLNEWLTINEAVWNWAIRKIDLDHQDGMYYSLREFESLLVGHSDRLGVPQSMLQSTLTRAWKTWKKCLRENKRVHPSKWVKPRSKHKRRPMRCIPLIHHTAIRKIDDTHFRILRLGVAKAFFREMPEGKIKCGYLLHEPSGWYLGLFIDCSPRKMQCRPGEMIGIDPGFKDLLNLSTGEKINGPGYIAAAITKTEERIKQARRGRDNNLTRRLYERLRNLKNLRNHIISKDVVQRFETIAYGVDPEALMCKHRTVRNKSGQKVKRKSFGASVNRAAHYQLRQMIKYKSAANGRNFIEVSGHSTTRKCSHCLNLTGPRGLAELGIRKWTCGSCNSTHDRDTNSATNTLMAALAL